MIHPPQPTSQRNDAGPIPVTSLATSPQKTDGKGKKQCQVAVSGHESDPDHAPQCRVNRHSAHRRL